MTALLQRLQAGVERLAALRGARARAAAMLAVALFYLATAAGNLSEQDDALAFAWRAEHIGVDHASDPRLIGYHTLARVLWLGAHALGLPASGLAVLHGISLAGAVLGLWLVWRLLVQRLDVPRPPALLATAALALSYGHWRYAVEGDVYVPAMALCAGVLSGLLAPRPGLLRTAVLGACGGVAVLVYQPNTIPLFLAFPWLVWRRQGLAAALAYVAAGCVVGGAGYLAGFLAWWPDPLSVDAFRQFLAQRSGEFAVRPLSLRTLATSSVQATLALGHDLLSANWAFGFDAVQRAAHRVFGANTLDEEIFLARRAGAWTAVPLVLLPALAAALWACWRAAALPWRQRLAGWPVGVGPALLLWTALTALVIGRLNPGGIEAWIVFLLPLHLVLARGLWAPACARAGAGLPALCVLLLGLHNLAGGMALVQDPRGDLVRLRADGLLAQARPGDLVLLAADLPLADRVRYTGGVEVLMLQPVDAQRLAVSWRLALAPQPPVLSSSRDFGGVDAHAAARAALARGGRVLVNDRFFDAARRPLDPFAATLQALLARSPVLQTNADGSTTHVLAPPGTGP